MDPNAVLPPPARSLVRWCVLLASAVAGGIIGAVWPRAALLGHWLYWGGVLFPDDVRPADSLWPRFGPASWIAIAAIVLVVIVRELRTRSDERRDPLITTAAWFMLIGAVAVLLVDVLGQMMSRARFPLDLLLWSESPFVQDMVKLNRGRCPYSPADQNNSFVYNPGAPLITWGLSRLFGRYGDLTFARGLQVAFTLLACGLAWATARVLIRGRTSDGPETTKPLHPIMIVGLALVVCAAGLNPAVSPYIDLLHNDALALLTATAGLAALALRERTGARRWLLWAAPLPMLAVLAKQTGSVVWIGMILGVLIQDRKFRSAAQFALASGAYIAAMAVGLTLWSHGWWTFWTMRVLAQQPIAGQIGLGTNAAVIPSLTLPLLVLLLWLAIHLARPRVTREPTVISSALYVGLLSGSATLTSFKVGACGPNHWGAAGLGMTTLAVAAAGRLLITPRQPQLVRLAVPLGLLLTVALLHRTTRPLPGPDEYRTAALLMNTFAQTDASRTLIDHGTLPYLKRNIIPIDRSNPILEVSTGGVGQVDQTVDRMLSQKYQRILIHDFGNCPWYVQVMGAIQIAYEPKFRLSGSRRRSIVSYLLGDVVVFEPKSATQMNAQPTFAVSTDPVVLVTTGRAPAEVRIRFSRPMNPATITPESVYLMTLEGDRIVPKWPNHASDLRYDAGSQSAVITTPASFWPGRYWIMVTGAARDFRGQPIWRERFMGWIEIQRFRWLADVTKGPDAERISRAEAAPVLRR